MHTGNAKMSGPRLGKKKKDQCSVRSSQFEFLFLCPPEISFVASHVCVLVVLCAALAFSLSFCPSLFLSFFHFSFSHHPSFLSFFHLFWLLLLNMVPCPFFLFHPFAFFFRSILDLFLLFFFCFYYSVILSFAIIFFS